MNVPPSRSGPGRLALTALTFLAFWAAGCATSKVHETYLQELQARQVKPMVYAKAEHFEILELSDIEHLVAQQVPEDQILYHLKKSRAMYQLTTQDVERLKKAEVSETIINYLLSTPARYRAYSYPPYYYPYPYYYHPYPYYGYPYYHHHHHGLQYHHVR